MRENNRFEKLNSSPLVLAALCLGVFLLLLYCNLHTDLVADDYRYCFSFADGSRISAVRQIFPSMAAHRLSMNGRLIPHFLVQLFLMAPKAVFNLVNALMFLQDDDRMPLQVVLRNLVLSNQLSASSSGAEAAEKQKIVDQLKYVIITVSAVPLMIVYPFLQKYFASGVMLGAVKG